MKNIFKSLAIVAVAIFAGYNVYQSNNETEGMSDTMLANVEALASGESIGTYDCCDNKQTCTGNYCGIFLPAGGSAVRVYYKK